jgi:hypothetical protein
MGVDRFKVTVKSIEEAENRLRILSGSLKERSQFENLQIGEMVN